MCVELWNNWLLMGISIILSCNTSFLSSRYWNKRCNTQSCKYIYKVLISSRSLSILYICPREKLNRKILNHFRRWLLFMVTFQFLTQHIFITKLWIKILSRYSLQTIFFFFNRLYLLNYYISTSRYVSALSSLRRSPRKGSFSDIDALNVLGIRRTQGISVSTPGAFHNKRLG